MRSKTHHTYNPIEEEIAVSALTASGRFRVLRKINLRDDPRLQHKTRKLATGICIDTETTGLNHSSDTVIELGIVVFEFNNDTGDIIRIAGNYSGFEDPKRPIPDEITKITGITNEMVHGQRFNDEIIEKIAANASIVVAHNAAFDRPFIEKRFPAFQHLSWFCTASQIDWKLEGISSRSLEFILYKYGYYVDAHRALNDAEGLLGLLLEQLPISKAPIFKILLANGSENIAKINAINAPYERKDTLKERGYRWNDGSNGTQKCWNIIVPESQEGEELDFLSKHIYPAGNTSAVEIKRISPVDRFSSRDK